MGNCGCKSTPCGCKSTGTAIVSTGCSCGGGGCAVCEPRAYVRPRFFAGQLLTDGDLGLLEDYVVAKNRLHNRALWGEGVVCGLDVTCDPCGGSNVVVQPGYAINCCGDDVVVPCPERVDVLALLRDLRKGMLNADCSDPCDQPPPQAPGSVPATPTGPTRMYYLYIRYVEDLTDPVSPYATDEPCAGQACEPTRIREGHVYELRCERTPRPHPRIGDALVACIPDERTSRSIQVFATLLVDSAQKVAAALAALPPNDAPMFAVGDYGTLSSATTTLNGALAALAPIVGGGGGDTSGLVSAAVDGVRQVGSLLARWAQTPAAVRPTTETSDVILRQARDAHGAAANQLPPMLGNGDVPAVQVTAHQQTLALAQRWVDGQAPPDTGFSDALFAYGGVLTSVLLEAELAADPELLAFIARRPTATTSSCTLPTKSIPPLPPPGTITHLVAIQYVAAAKLQGQLAAATLQECMCAAFNPPCVTCDDPGVLLATVCVSNCAVVDICNNVRTWVISPKALRYWIGFPTLTFASLGGLPLDLAGIGALVEQMCCGARPFGCPPAPTMTTPALTPTLTRMFAMPPAAVASPPASDTASPNTPPGDAAITARVNAAVATALAATTRQIENLRTQLEALRPPTTPGVG